VPPTRADWLAYVSCPGRVDGGRHYGSAAHDGDDALCVDRERDRSFIVGSGRASTEERRVAGGRPTSAGGPMIRPSISPWTGAFVLAALAAASQAQPAPPPSAVRGGPAETAAEGWRVLNGNAGE
jgi:hypothetical protein